MDVVLLTTDLMAVSRVQGAVARVGVGLHCVPNTTQAMQQCRDAGPSLLIVDLATAALDLDFIQQLRADDSFAVQVVAFGPHVHEERLAAARDVGCDLVLSRGRFFSEVDTIVQNAAG